MRHAIALALLASALSGCSSPTEPSTFSIYQWQSIAAGCTPDQPVPQISRDPDALFPDDYLPGYRLGLWKEGERIIVAAFKPFGPIYQLCVWKE